MRLHLPRIRCVLGVVLGVIVVVLLVLALALSRVLDTRKREQRLVFIDAGGNTGQTVQWFAEGAGDIFGSHLHSTSPDPKDYEIFVFEPNPVFRADYDQLKRQGLRFTLLQAAVADADGYAEFSGQGQGGLISAGGVSKERSSPSAVDAVDFSRWIRETFGEHDYLICKIDIEGAETPLVTKMMRDGTVCRCNRLSVEWHSWIGTPTNAHEANFNSAHAMQTASALLEGQSMRANETLSCSIPHAKRPLPFDHCLLPLVFAAIRRSCTNGVAPLEKWW
ncbi:hypothetical protein FVE85_2384 [Porphyridium purpureum]|uniref:Methyltransferase FkbM domain-containing protein n=1 Tax=Porphyridium purpureum TaxID=35688 RepID=A0A5J4YXC1_PORPP|nr:hypothetical protein FVE85_2384 [Porphyridium purpureum]|eukprot:POR0604..scf209_3